MNHGKKILFSISSGYGDGGTEKYLRERKISSVHSYVQEVNSTFSNEKIKHGWHTRKIDRVGWNYPSKGWAKLNTDGCQDKDSGTEGIRGVLKDEKGSWIVGLGHVWYAGLSRINFVLGLGLIWSDWD